MCVQLVVVCVQLVVVCIQLYSSDVCTASSDVCTASNDACTANLVVCVKLVVVCVFYWCSCTHESAVLCDGCGTDYWLSASLVVSGEKRELICIVILFACYMVGVIRSITKVCYMSLCLRQ